MWELYDSFITLEEYNASVFLKQQYTWKQVQEYFEQNQTGLQIFIWICISLRKILIFYL